MERSKTREEVAREYGVSRRTFYGWLKQADIHIQRGLLTPRDIQKIYDHFWKARSTEQKIVQRKFKA